MYAVTERTPTHINRVRIHASTILWTACGSSNLGHRGVGKWPLEGLDDEGAGGEASDVNDLTIRLGAHLH